MANPTVPLGLEEQVCAYTCQGVPSTENLALILERLVYAVGMTLDGPPDISSYPNADGKGGEGCQIYQKLTESFVVGGTWPAHGFTRIVLSSCKPYEQETVEAILTGSIGPITRSIYGNL